MAIFKPSALIDGLSGKIGGTVFALGRGAGVARNNTPGTNSSSQASADYRVRYSFMMSRWRACTLDQRNAWQTLANACPSPNRFGIRRRLSPMQFFLWCRWPFASYHGSYADALSLWTGPEFNLNNPPTLRSCVYPSDFLVYTDDPPIDGSITWTMEESLTRQATRIQISRSFSTTRKPRPFWVTVYCSESYVGGNNLMTMSADFAHKAGMPADGERLRVRATFHAADSLPTPWYEFDWYFGANMASFPPLVPYAT